MKGRIYYAYIRVSTAKQGEHGVSLQEQKAAIERYAQHNGLSISEWFEERETAAKRGRPIFLQMLRLLRQGKAHGIIIHKIDRSARNLKDWADLGEMIDRGIDVHFANESLDLNTRGGRLSADIQAVVAADYIRNLREETKKGMYGRLKQGFYPLQAPVGYLDRGKAKPKDPDPERAPLIRKAFELYASGDYTFRSLTQEIYRLGLRNKRGGRITLDGISTILNNPFYLGLIRLRKTGETFQGLHQPIITKSLYDRVQAVLRGRLAPRPLKHNFLFRKLLQCASCGKSLIGELQKERVYYRCHSQSCPTTSVREDWVDNQIAVMLNPLRYEPGEQAYLDEQLSLLRQNSKESQEEQVKALNLRISQLQDRYTRLTDAYIDRLIEKDVYEDRKATLLMQKKEVEEKLKQIQEGVANLPDQMAAVLDLGGMASDLYDLGLPEHRRELLRMITSNRWIAGKKLELMLVPAFEAIRNRRLVLNGAPDRDWPRIWDGIFEKLPSLVSVCLIDLSRWRMLTDGSRDPNN